MKSLGRRLARRIKRLLHRNMPRIGNLHLALGPIARVSRLRLDLPHNLHAVEHLAKHDVLAIQPRRLNGRNEELTAVGVAPGIGHAEPARSIMLEL